jgi:hypothetical protein
VQDAVNAALAGAIIQIAPGTYEAKDPNSENNVSLTISKSLTLRGLGQKPEDVILTANQRLPVLRIENAQNVTVENLTVRDGNGGDGGTYPGNLALPGEFLGGGLHIKDSGRIVLRGLQITDNWRYGLMAWNVRDLQVEQTQFLRTAASPGNRAGSGFFCYRCTGFLNTVLAAENRNPGLEILSSDMQIRDSVLRSNTNYGGLFINGVGEEVVRIQIERALIEKNGRYGAWVAGKAIVNMSEVKILNSNPKNEIPWWGTGLIIADQSQVRFSQGTLEGNRGEGVIVQGQATLTMGNSTITDTRDHPISPGGATRSPNICNFGRTNGLGLCVTEQARAMIEKTIITDNKIGIWAFQGGRVTLGSSTITQSDSFGIGLGSNRYRTETAHLESVGSVIAENSNCGITSDIDQEIKITGQENTGGQTSGAPDACDSAVQKIPPGFWK